MTQQQESRRPRALWFGATSAGLLLLVGSGTAVVSNTASSSGAGSASAKPTPAPTASGCGNCNSNSGSGQGNGGGAVTGPVGHPIVVTGSVTGAVRPGSTTTLTVTIDNRNNQDIVVRSITGSITSVSRSSCDTSWFVLVPYTGNKTIRKNGSDSVPVSFSMLESGTNQDSCKGASLALAFTATADSV